MKRIIITLFTASALLSCASGPTRQHDLVARAVKAMGGAPALAALRTVTASGTVRQWEPEQSDAPGGEMRFANSATFQTIQDRAAGAARTDWVKNFAYPSPRTFTYSEIVTADAGYVLGVDSNGRNAQSLKSSPPAHTMSSLRLATSQREGRRNNVTSLLLAMHNNRDAVYARADVAVDGRNWPAVGFQDLVVLFDPRTHLPVLIRSADYDNIWGDVDYDLVLSEWREVDGVTVPMMRRARLNGRTISETQITALSYNRPVDVARLQIPRPLLPTAAKPATGNVPYQWVLRRQFIGTYMDSENVSYDTQGSSGLRLQDIGRGVSQTQGGTHNSMIVEMRDHLVVFDAPVSDWQSLWVVEAARAKYPGKPIRYLVLTHHHMDHTGGLRGFLAGGARLVVGKGAAAHFRRVLNAPISRNPDLRGADFGRTDIIEVEDRYVISDGRRQVQAILMDSPHAKATLMGYVPDIRLGFVTDIWSPGVPLPAKPNPGLVAVVNAVSAAKIFPLPERFAGGHGSIAEYAGLARLAGQ